MKKQFLRTLFLSSLSVSILLTSCETTDTGGVTPANTTGPTVSLSSGTGIINADASVAVGADFTVNIISTKGSNPLKVLTVQEAGVNVPLERIKINGTVVSANPTLLFGNDKNALDYKITVKAHSDVAAKAYAFIIEDEGGKKETKTITITTQGIAPKLELKTGDSLNIAPNSLFSSTFSVTKGSAALKSIEIQENGVKVADVSRLFYDKLTTPFTANPQAIATADKDAFNKAIIINSPTTSGRYVYTFIFTDELGLSTSKKVTLIVGSKAELISGALLNAAGPDGTGGLDLDTGKGIGSANASAEIRDEGIDIGEPLATNWKQQISGVNGSVVRYIVKGQNGVATDFTFAGVNSKEEISALFAKGVAFTKTNGTRSISNKIAVGDVLIVQNGTKYYLLSIKSVNISKTDNDDEYVIDIKK